MMASAGVTFNFRSLLFSLDIDECSTNSHRCDVNAVCSNNVGSYACACKAGFTGDGNTCTGESFKSNEIFVFLVNRQQQQYKILYLYSSRPSNKVLGKIGKKL